mmetsp:Transcript_8445/g.30442  ORF Transcript_8445/g.30442 Transcript_8445/m.30442 type:complete len:211 (-) Transcript_8445:44-676(-)
MPSAMSQAARRSSSNLIEISEKNAINASGYHRIGSGTSPKSDVDASGGMPNDWEVIAMTSIGHNPLQGTMYQVGSSCAIPKAKSKYKTPTAEELNMNQSRNRNVPCSCSNRGKYDRAAIAETAAKSSAMPGLVPSLATNQKSGNDQSLPSCTPLTERPKDATEGRAKDAMVRMQCTLTTSRVPVGAPPTSAEGCIIPPDVRVRAQRQGEL